MIGEGDEKLLVGPQSVDDAGVVELEHNTGAPTDTLLVQTVDYFPPVVDDARAYGRIAAANALSDVYAMGGRAYSALNLAGFPRDFSDEWIGEILAGGFVAMEEAGCVVAGGQLTAACQYYHHCCFAEALASPAATEAAIRGFWEGYCGIMGFR